MRLAARRKIVVSAPIALDFPGKGSIAVDVDGRPPGSLPRPVPTLELSASSPRWETEGSNPALSTSESPPSSRRGDVRLDHCQTFCRTDLVLPRIMPFLRSGQM